MHTNDHVKSEPPYLLRFRALVLPVTDLVDPGDGVHGHETDGQSNRAYDHL